MKKILTTTIISLSLTACSSLGQTEITALKQAGINDARNAGKELHLAFLQCYALQEVDKKNCQRMAGSNNPSYAAAVTWDYIRPFRYEAEKLGFKAFLNDQGKTCKAINDGPMYDADQKAYAVNCTSGQTYYMRFDTKEVAWQLER